MKSSHWVGLEADPDNYLGFIYLIEDLTTGQKYVGKKNYWVAKPKAVGCRSKSQDKGSPKWKPSCWKESNWRVYKGSSKPLAKHMRDNRSNKYRYTILHHCRSKGVLSYTECREMYDRRVLESLLPNGEYEYFNLAIGAIKFRPKDHMSDETRLKMSRIQRDNVYSLGKPCSQSTKAKMSKAQKGRVITPETRLKMSKSFKGRIITPEAKAKMSEAKKNYNIYTFLKDGKVFIGTKYELIIEDSSSKLIGVDRLITGKQKTHNGWSLQRRSHE